VFVADEIPVELRRIVEFINGQMDPAELLAVEIKQYVGGDSKVLKKGSAVVTIGVDRYAVGRDNTIY
jgi:hypothetical protein